VALAGEDVTASMFQSELSTPDENGQRPLTTKPPSTLRARPAASAIDEAMSASGLASHTSCWVSGS
jgi:hypothetical protein